jgi:hypothetical protein
LIESAVFGFARWQTGMGRKQISSAHSTRVATRTVFAGLFAVAFVLVSGFAAAQDAQPGGSNAGKNENFFESIGRWLAEQSEKINSGFRDAGKNFANFGHEAGIAAKVTVDGAKDAADAVARIPAARVMAGHVKCKNAPNGAPDCISAATSLCKAKGFETGKSMDMTTAEVCPPQVYLAGRNSGPGCRTETFVSRALCQ